MRNELYRSVSWLGSNTRTYLTHSASRYLILGIAAIFAAFLTIQAMPPAQAQTEAQCETRLETLGSVLVCGAAGSESLEVDDTQVRITFFAVEGADSYEFYTGGDFGTDHDRFMLSDPPEGLLFDGTATALVTASGEPLSPGTYKVSIVGSLLTDSTMETTVNLTIVVLQTLKANGMIPQQNLAVDQTRLVPLGDRFTAAEGADLTYTVTVARGGIVRATLQGSNVRLVGLGEGRTEVTVTATDSNGNTAMQKFTARVSGAPPVLPTNTPIPPTPVPPTPIPPSPTPTAVPPTPTPPIPTNTPEPTAEPTATPEPTATTAPTPPTAEPVEPTPTPEPEDGGIGIGGIIIGLIVLALLGVLAFFLLRRRGGDDGGAPPYGGPTSDNGMNGDDNGDDVMDDNGGDTDDADDNGDGEDEEENR